MFHFHYKMFNVHGVWNSDALGDTSQNFHQMVPKGVSSRLSVFQNEIFLTTDFDRSKGGGDSFMSCIVNMGSRPFGSKSHEGFYLPRYNAV
jgi:hypothetical protein